VAPVTPPAPTSWTVSGRVVSANGRAGVAGARITFGDAAPLVTDASGAFAIVTTDTTTKPLTIEAPGYATRETSLTGGEVRTGVEFDLLGFDPAFPYAQYREEVRNGYERPAHLEPSRRWTTNPSLFIWTTWRDTGAAVNPAGVETLIAEVQRIVPLWTAGRFHVDQVETSPSDRPRQKGWINVRFDHSGNWSLLGEDPGWVQFGGDTFCGSLAIAHEFGHAMGYWHTATRPSIMGGGPGTCTKVDLTANEAAIARAMYDREPGNLDPDKDGPPPPPPIYYFGPSLARDDGATPPVIVRCDAVLRR
jgi:hypothetical protein